MAANHGSKAAFKMQPTGGGANVDLSSYITSVGFPRTIETAQVQGLGSTAKAYVIGLEDGQFSIEGIWDPTLDAQVNAAKRGAASTEAALSWEFGPSGTATGSVKYTGNAFIVAYDVSANLTDAAKFTLSLQLSGVITRTVY